MLTQYGDIDHICLKIFFKHRGLARNRHSKLESFVFVQKELNIKISNKSSATYMVNVVVQCSSGRACCGAITRLDDPKYNLVGNCLPTRTV